MKTFNYYKATDVQLMERLLMHMKRIQKNDIDRLSLSFFEQEKPGCGTFRCIAGWAGHYDGIEVNGNKFKDIFDPCDYSDLPPEKPIYDRLLSNAGWAWFNVFGSQSTQSVAKELADRIEWVEDFIVELKDAEVNP